MTLTSYEIRKRFLDFFASKGHTIVASDSVVPKDDPTVLFTTAGMQQFKRQFLGYIGDYTRAASSQKCLRTDDLDKVGKTDVHHTFFEMLGNFSFGDYFKKEAIAWAWEFLTKELKISAEKFWVSVYTDDDEAAQIWLKDIKIDPKKLVRLGDKSNFWPAEAKEKGPNGPCGPCSEIFYDYGVNPKCTSKKCDLDCNCGRFSEIWNLVFTQFNRQEGGVLEPLPNKNIDTGMGLERLVAVVQGKKGNYETDLFEPILKVIDNNIKGVAKTDRLIIADHVRAITFGIADGVIPSNEGRGYVVKRLINDATDIAIHNGATQPVIHKFVQAVVIVMEKHYPAIRDKQQQIIDTIKNAEESFIKIRNEKIPIAKEKGKLILESNKPYEKKIDELSDLGFFFKDTYGMTVGTFSTTTIGTYVFSNPNEEQKYKADLPKAIDQKMEKRQRQKSRAKSKMAGDVFVDEGLELDIPKTEFIGYEHTHDTGKILRLFIDNKTVKEVSRGDQVKVVLDKTPFYAEAGGQVGDTGYVIGKKGKLRVEDTQKINDVHVHRGVVEDGLLRVDETVETKIDAERRLAIMRHHTATHLLQAALREVLGKHVQQQGSLVAEDRLRFDFSHPKAVSKEEIKRIEDRVSENVAAAIPVQKEVLSIEEAKKKGALAFFAEKYGEKVRVVSIGNISKEFCGGTHLKNTSEIGVFKISSEGAVAQGIRRLEAKTGKEAELFIQEKKAMERESAELTKLKQLETEAERARCKALIQSLDQEIKSSPEIAGTKIFNKVINDVKVDTLKSISDFIKQAAKSSAVILGSRTNGTATIIVAITDDLVKRGISARDIVKEIAPLIEGSGGGAPQMAQAGSKRVEKIEDAVQKAGKLIRERIRK